MITIEMAYIVPVIFLVFFLSVLGIFYYHDKDVLTACAYETAVVGSVKMRENGGVSGDTICALFRERAYGKCILFSGADVEAEIGEEEVRVYASAVRGRFRMSVSAASRITKPEEKIRKYRRVEWNIT